MLFPITTSPFHSSLSDTDTSLSLSLSLSDLEEAADAAIERRNEVEISTVLSRCSITTDRAEKWWRVQYLFYPLYSMGLQNQVPELSFVNKNHIVYHPSSSQQMSVP